MARRVTVAVAGLVFTLSYAGSTVPAFSQAGTPSTTVRQASSIELLTQPIADNTPNAEQLRLGQYLLRVGDCASCHTPTGGPALAGALGLNTPFGVIYSTNLTSDPETGVGQMSPDAFFAALHDGVGPQGGPLYPAMPYNYFTRVTREDSDAMLAYLKTTPAVQSQRPPNELEFPLNIRFTVHGWNLLFFSPGSFSPDPGKSADWNRGAYLVTGLGHCGSCHTPKNVFAADESGQALHGGTLDNWVAPDLTANTRTGLGAWSVDDVVEYLKTGRNARANAGGAMAEVVSNSTSLMTDQDVHAMAVYLKDQVASPSPAVAAPDQVAMRRGEAIYSDACASCHMADGGGQPRFFAPLVGNSMLQQSDPTGLTHLILAGSRTAPTPSRPTPLSMPSFAWKLTNQQVADVSTYIRNSWGNQASPVSASAVEDMRKRLGLTVPRLTDNSGDHFAPASTAETGK